MLVPKKVKFRKWQTGRTNKSTHLRPETRGTSLSFGSHGLKFESHARITSNQIEAGRKAMSKSIKKVGKMWIRIFPDRPYTQKPAEVKMGKGKGDVQGYCVEVRPGRILFEIDGVDDATARDALRRAGSKMPGKTRVVIRSAESH